MSRRKWNNITSLHEIRYSYTLKSFKQKLSNQSTYSFVCKIFKFTSYDCYRHFVHEPFGQPESEFKRSMIVRFVAYNYTDDSKRDNIALPLKNYVVDF